MVVDFPALVGTFLTHPDGQLPDFLNWMYMEPALDPALDCAAMIGLSPDPTYATYYKAVSCNMTAKGLCEIRGELYDPTGAYICTETQAQILTPG